MREDAFRAFLTPRLGARSVDSYLSNLRRVEQTLACDIENRVLDPGGIVSINGLLRQAGMLDAKISDCGSALRQYADFLSHKTVRPSPVPAAGVDRPMAGSTIAELMQTYAAVLAELRHRKISRTANGPVGDYAEWLFARAFDWRLADNNEAHYDATDAEGARYQIKGRRVMSGPGGQQLGALRRLPDHGFDILAAVLFDARMKVLRAVLIPYAVVVRRARPVEHTNSWRFMLSDAVWHEPGVRDATEILRLAAQ